MNKLESLPLIIALSAFHCAGVILAQTTNGDPKSTTVPAVEAPATTSEEPVQVVKDDEQKMQYAAALDGTGLISLDNREPGHLFFGATISGGWDSNPDNLANGVASGVYTLSPYVGIQTSTPKTQYLFQYQSTISGFSSSSYARQNMNVASAKIVGNASNRWNWDLKATGSYGQDSIRFLGSQQTVVVGEVPGTGPSSASYLPNAGTITYVDGSGEVGYRKSERDSFDLRISNAFSRYSGLRENNGIASSSLSYNRDLSPTFGVRSYGQNVYYYGSLHCESYGGGVGIRWQPAERTSLSLSGGPQFNTSACGSQQGFSYNASFSTRLSGKSQIYLLSDRQPTTSYLGPGLWQNSASGGYQRQLRTVGTISFDVGYVASDTLTTVGSYHGTYFDCVYGYRLGHGIRASYSYRGYVGDSGGTHSSRNVALFSIAWTPSAGHVFQ